MSDDLWGEETARQWEKFQPPSRPSKSELEVYERYIKKLPNDSVSMLMGSTPEIRDMFAKEKKKVYVIDWSESNYRALKTLMREKDTSNEVFLNQDWREMKFDFGFDFIIGDLALLVLNRVDSIKVMKNIAKCLKKDGKSIQRMWIRNHTKPYPLDDILELYKNKPVNESLWSWLELPILFHDYDYDKEEFNAQHCYDIMQEYVRQEKMPTDILETFEVFKYFNAPLNIPLKSEFEKSIGQYFIAGKIECGKECFAENALIYLLKHSSY